MIISNQKRMAAQILSKKEGREVGVHRVWINPDYLDEVSTAVQKADIRQLIEEGLIKARPIKGTSRGRARNVLHKKQKVAEKDLVLGRVQGTLEIQRKIAGCV